MKFGWSEIDITPKEPISLAGEFFERVTKEVETPISVTALAIEEKGEQSVFVSCDLVVITEELTAAVRSRIGKIGLDTDKIIICAIHDHTSYTYRRTGPFPKVKFNAEAYFMSRIPSDCQYIPEDSNQDSMDTDRAFDFLADSIAKAVTEAWNNRREGGFATGFGRAAVGMCRRATYSDGRAKMWGDTDTAAFVSLEGGNDNGVEMLFTYDENKKLTGVVANVCCPAQVMEQRTVISSDYWGKLKILLREKYGKDLFLLPLGGPGGDQCPRDLVRWVEPETPIKDPNVIRNQPKLRDADPSMFDVKGTWKIGRRLFNEVVMALDEVEEIRTEAIHCHSVENLRLPLRRVTPAEVEEAEKRINEFFKGRTTLNYMDTAALYVESGVVLRSKEQEIYNSVTCEIHTVRLGNVVLSSNPFELFLDYGNQIRARSQARQTFLIQLANGAYAYLPTEKAEKAGHYSAYVSSGYVGHEGGELLVDAALDQIDGLFE